MRVSRPWDLELAYTRVMMAYLLFHPAPDAVLMIGLGGGSLAKYIRKFRPQTHITAVEIDDRIINAAHTYFELPLNDDTLQVIHGDGAVYMPEHPACADVILLDGYDSGNQVEALATEAFYAACRRSLRPNGVLVVNLWGRDGQFTEYFARLLRAFGGEVGWISVMGKTNVVAFAFADSGARNHMPIGKAEVARLTQHYGLDFSGFIRDWQWAGAETTGPR